MFADKIHMHTTQMRIGNDLSDQHSKQTQDKTFYWLFGNPATLKIRNLHIKLTSNKQLMVKGFRAVRFTPKIMLQLLHIFRSNLIVVSRLFMLGEI